MRVAIYHQQGYYRSEALADAMARGLLYHGHQPVRLRIDEFAGVRGEAAIFYGFGADAPQIMQAYRAKGYPVVNMDLGYWSRDSRKRMQGYNKVSVNARHPDAYFMRRAQQGDRFERLSLQIAPWRSDGGPIVVCGMSDKAARAAGLRFLEWETDIVSRIRALTDRQIVFRAKPNKRKSFASLPGVESVSSEIPIEQALRGAWACVARHSNACADALISGVPVYCEEGIASALSMRLDQIDNPPLPDGREQWAWNAAYCQWTTDEMRNGECWAFLKNEGLV